MKFCGVWFWLPFLMMGCATEAQMQAQNIDNEWADATEKYVECYQQNVVSAPEYLPIAERFITGPNDPSALQKMADASVVSEQDKKDILAYRATETPCITTAVSEFGQAHPAYAVLITGFYANRDKNVARLMRGEITIGEFNEFLNELYTKFHKDLEATHSEIAQNLSRAHQYEQQKRMLAAQMMHNWGYQMQVLSQQQQMINAMNRPLTTNCRYLGQIWNCTTQ